VAALVGGVVALFKRAMTVMQCLVLEVWWSNLDGLAQFACAAAAPGSLDLSVVMYLFGSASV
jgi:hypothetical protein